MKPVEEIEDLAKNRYNWLLGKTQQEPIEVIKSVVAKTNERCSPKEIKTISYEQ